MAALPHSSHARHAMRATSFALLAVILLLSACSSDSATETERAVAPTPIPEPSGIGANGEELTLEVMDGGEATGLVITDHRGFAVYGVTGEIPEGKPTCFGDCLDIWIPVSPRDIAVSNRLDADLFEVWTRPEGFEQAVYAGIPLYLWSGDREIGVTGGAGVAGTWFALTQTAGFIAQS